MKTVDVFSVLWFHCPRCELANFIRQVFVQRGDRHTVEPVRPSVCEHCTYVLTNQEKAAHENGGAALFAWRFTSDECGIDNVETRIIYRDTGSSSLASCSKAPPRTSTCRSCSTEFGLHLPDVLEGTHGPQD
jgi:hypothetical protein